MPEIPHYFRNKLHSYARVNVQPRLEAEVAQIVRRSELLHTLEDFYANSESLERPDHELRMGDQVYDELVDQVRLPLKQQRTLVLFDKQFSLPGKKIRYSS